MLNEQGQTGQGWSQALNTGAERVVLGLPRARRGFER